MSRALKVSTKGRKRLVSKANSSIHKSPLKWAGGKRKLIQDIIRLIPKQDPHIEQISKLGPRLIEPFVGGGSVFLNMDFSTFQLVDSNPDLIDFFNHIKTSKDKLSQQAKNLFIDKHNNADAYYDLRAEFNQTRPSLRRSVLFLYLNRHGYNGLCRYNRKGGYNVPFGKYKKPYFPEIELSVFAKKAKQANFIAGDFALAFENVIAGDIVYCDPPYTPIDLTANFTAYSGIGFLHEDQARLAQSALKARDNGVTTIISNNDLPITRDLYKNADKIVSLKVARTISCKGNIRRPCKELMALFKAR